MARLLLAALVLAGAWGGWHIWQLASGGIMLGNQTKSSTPTPTAVANKEPDEEKTVVVAEDLAERIAFHEKLPAISVFGVVGLPAFGRDQHSNKIMMSNLLDSLAGEIGATKAAGAIRTLKANREAGAQIEQLARSEDPATIETAKKQLEKMKKENETLEEVVRESLAKEGMDLTAAQVKALCASPNAEDTASMISSFGALKIISAKMEHRLRMKPSQDQAQKYYGAHCAMLMALDKIQKRAMANIESLHIPRARQIRQDSEATSGNASQLLAERTDLSRNERQALAWNIGSCKKTVEMTVRTEEKLLKNLEIIRRANQKLLTSIETAQNCHMTAMLQKEIMGLETAHTQEIARIEALTVPELAAINFADPENIEVSPPPPGPNPRL